MQLPLRQDAHLLVACATLAGLLSLGCESSSQVDAGATDAQVDAGATDAQVDAGATDAQLAGDAQAPDAAVVLPSGCAEVVAELTRCYPDLRPEDCTDETLMRFAGMDVSTMTCTELDALGTAETIDPGACGIGRHVCNGLFCCSDYRITQTPSDPDWEIIALIDDYQSRIPTDVSSELAVATPSDLRAGVTWDWEQDVVSEDGGTAVSMAVHLSSLLIDVDYATFAARLPTEEWGIRLNQYLGGEVRVYERDSEGRATRQIERMVLTPFPLDIETRLSNQDMTKAEIIRYDADRARVYWRVYYSDNDSTEADVGTVEFQSQGTGTLVTFHSAHRLNGPLGVHLSNRIVRLTLGGFFLGHAESYRAHVGS